jgi:UDP-N-acetylglucosamine transferase subunit ALG13
MEERYSIFATLGNATQPFDRFVRMLDEAAEKTGLPTLIQLGRSFYRPRYANGVGFVERAQFERLVQQADHVVTHAGVGSVMAAIRFGKTPLVVVRRKDLGEVINDHQQDLADELSSLELIRVVTRLEELVEWILRPPRHAHARPRSSNRRMLELVQDFISY